MRTIKRDIVGSFIFSKDNKILLGLSIDGGVYKDEWIVPGGGIEEGETKLEALKREVLEEVGIDITGAKIEEIDDISIGKSEKVLRDTGERVLVEMKFHDYSIYLPQMAADIPVSLDDDLAKAEWFSAEDLSQVHVSNSTKDILVKIGFLKEG